MDAAIGAAIAEKYQVVFALVLLVVNAPRCERGWSSERLKYEPPLDQPAECPDCCRIPAQLLSDESEHINLVPDHSDPAGAMRQIE